MYKTLCFTRMGAFCQRGKAVANKNTLISCYFPVYKNLLGNERVDAICFIFPLNCSPHVHFSCSDRPTCFGFHLYITNPHCLALVRLLVVAPSLTCTVFLLFCVLLLLVFYQRPFPFFGTMLMRRSFFLSLLLVHLCPLRCLSPIQGFILFPSGCIYVKRRLLSEPRGNIFSSSIS